MASTLRLTLERFAISKSLTQIDTANAQDA